MNPDSFELKVPQEPNIVKSDPNPSKSISNKARLIEFDLLKCLAIFLVVCGHAIMHLSSNDKTENEFYTFIYSFHMPLFMLISGFFSAKSLELPFRDLFKKKFIQLIYPCISFGIIFYLIDLLVFKIENNGIINYFYNIFWFLKSCFLCYLIFYFCLRISATHKYLGCLIGLLISQVIPAFKITWMLPFFIAGYILFQNYTQFVNKAKYFFWPSLFLFIILFLVSRKMEPIDLVSLKNELLSGNLTFLREYFIFHILRLVIGSAGSIMIISAILLLSNKIGINKTPHILTAFGQQTLGIYIIQTYLLEELLSRYVDLSHTNELVFTYIIVPLVSIALMYLSYILINLIVKSRITNRFFWWK